MLNPLSFRNAFNSARVSIGIRNDMDTVSTLDGFLPAPGLLPPRLSLLFMFRDFLKQFDRFACRFQRIDESVGSGCPVHVFKAFPL